MKAQKFVAIVFFTLVSQFTFSQDLIQEKMEQLHYLVGEWIGTSTIYENGVAIKQGSAYEKISYDLIRVSWSLN